MGHGRHRSAIKSRHSSTFGNSSPTIAVLRKVEELSIVDDTKGKSEVYPASTFCNSSPTIGVRKVEELSTVDDTTGKTIYIKGQLVDRANMACSTSRFRDLFCVSCAISIREHFLRDDFETSEPYQHIYVTDDHEVLCPTCAYRKCVHQVLLYQCRTCNKFHQHLSFLCCLYCHFWYQPTHVYIGNVPCCGAVPCAKKQEARRQRLLLKHQTCNLWTPCRHPNPKQRRRAQLSKYISPIISPKDLIFLILDYLWPRAPKRCSRT